MPAWATRRKMAPSSTAGLSTVKAGSTCVKRIGPPSVRREHGGMARMAVQRQTLTGREPGAGNPD